jgi:hypothetical protein
VRSTRRLKAGSLLSMAVTAALGAPVARAATLTLYYDNISDSDGQSYGYGVTGANYANVPTTINIAVGDTFEFGIDAVVTNNVNPDAGEKTGTPGHTLVQPSFLGLSSLSIAIPSSDERSDFLVPVTSGPPNATFYGSPDYDDTASLNNQGGAGDSKPINNGSNPAVPIWNESTVGDVLPGTNGDVGDHLTIFQGNGPVSSNSKSGAIEISQYGASIASYAMATDFFSGLSYLADRPGRVVLSPQVDFAGTGYWSNTQAGSSSMPSGYGSTFFNNPGDVIGKLPSLVINITGVGPPLRPVHPIVSLTASAAGAPTNYGPLLGTMTANELGLNGLGTFSNTSLDYGYVEASEFNSPQEIYALSVMVNGKSATQAQVDKLVNIINNGDSAIPAASGVLAADSYSKLPTLAPNFFFGENLFLEFPSVSSNDNFFAVDLTTNGDPNLVGYSFHDIQVGIPEPSSLGLLALGGLGLLGRRNRRRRDG